MAAWISWEGSVEVLGFPTEQCRAESVVLNLVGLTITKVRSRCDEKT